MSTSLPDIEEIESKIQEVNGIEFGNPALHIGVEAHIEFHSDDFTIYLSYESEFGPRAFHAIYNDWPAFTELVNGWADATDADEVWADIEELEDAYNQAITAGWGDWHRGVRVLASQARSAVRA